MIVKKVLFITTEMSPYVDDTEMSLVARNLPEGIHNRGNEIRVFMPKFGLINERRYQLHEIIRLSGMNLIINETDYPLLIKVASLQAAKMQIYFIDNDDFFCRKYSFKDEEGEEFEDNDIRCVFYVRGVLETIKKLRWAPDVIHCHGWATALAPLYIKKHFKNDPCFKKSKIVYSLYGDDFQKPFRKDFVKTMKIEGVTQNDIKVIKEQTDFISLSKLAMNFSDGIIEGSADVNTFLLDYAKQQENVRFLPFQPENTYIEDFDNFYDQLLLS